jgi:hypothetical protein
MNVAKRIFEETFGALLAVVVLGAILNWAATHATTGLFVPVLDTLAAVAAIVLDPSTALLLLAVGYVWEKFVGF